MRTLRARIIVLEQERDRLKADCAAHYDAALALREQLRGQS